MTRTSDEIRREFIGFFTDRGHTFVPSSPLLLPADPTLLFANAGMNQFKDVFLGAGARPYARAVNSQKCIRAGGKHNDLEDVGHDTYHQTFFEMLGNWSFGDYFKAEAIEWAWELLTGVWGLPAERLWATVFGGDAPAGLEADAESAGLWAKIALLPPGRIVSGDLKNNFWEMGETGPCGPCTEVHIDLGEGVCDGSAHAGAKCGVNVPGCGRFIELWNLVFIQFNRDEKGSLSPLPARHVDTGMGFERISAVLQGKTSNYDSDVFAPLMGWLEDRCGAKYGAAAETDVAFRVVADHLRAIAFAIADGVAPSNDGRGYVIRRILRRAARFGRKLGRHEPFLHEMVDVLVGQMGEVYPEIVRGRDRMAATIREEEASFNRTLDRGLDIFERAAAGAQQQISGQVAFELYATYGFPVDLTQVMAAERGLTVDMAGYEAEMAAHREISSVPRYVHLKGSAGWQTRARATLTLRERIAATDDSAKYAGLPVQATVLGWVDGDDYVDEPTQAKGDEVAVVLDRTNFYAEQGGQVGDTGTMTWPGGRFDVRVAKFVGRGVAHIGAVVEGSLSAGQTVTLEVSPARADTRRNHTGTHLLNWALRKVLGGEVDQAGSVVEPERLRFDFTHGQAVSAGQLAAVERLVNERVLADEPVHVSEVPLAEARKIPGVRALFGEKYPDPVRVMSVGAPASEAGAGDVVEFCGGTHVERTSQVGLFKIISEESVARGVRRVTAVTGLAAVEYVQRVEAAARSAAAALRVPVEQVAERIEALQAEVKGLRKRPAGGAEGGAFQPEFTVETPAGPVLIGQVALADPAAMRRLCDVERQRGAGGVLVGAGGPGKVTLIAMGCPGGGGGGKVRADEWVRAAAGVVGGSGGGKPTMAQAGGKEPDRLPDALKAAEEWIRARLA